MLKWHTAEVFSSMGKFVTSSHNKSIERLASFYSRNKILLSKDTKRYLTSISGAPFHYNTYDSLPETPTFELTSIDILEGGTMPEPQLSKTFGVEGGQDKSPSLSWKGFPENTKFFVVTCYDPDAPPVSGFWHWIMYDVPASVTSSPTGAGDSDNSNIPDGAKVLKNDAGFSGFCGAAPPPGHGPHRYNFCVTALP